MQIKNSVQTQTKPQTKSTISPKKARAKMRRWQILTIILLLAGYTGYYLCRSYFNVIKPELLLDGELGLDVKQIGLIASIGTLFYAVGKVASGIVGDFVGGKLLFVVGMIGSALCTLYFGLGLAFPVFVTAWAANQFLQSGGWNGLVKIASNWFSYRNYGRVMAVLSLSYLFGDAFARYILGAMLADGYGWRPICFWAAAILSVLAVITWLLLKTSPSYINTPEPEVNPANLHGIEGHIPKANGIFQLLIPYLESLPFWIVLLMSLGLTLIRSTINEWSTTYLTNTLHLSTADAAKYSAIFPLTGGISALLAGFFSDYLAKGRRGMIMAFGCFCLSIVFVAPYFLGQKNDLQSTVIFLGLIGLFLIGPYTFLSGAISIDLGGKRGSSTAAGMVDAAGYFGGIAAGYGFAIIVENYSWQAVFLVLAVVAILTFVASVMYWRIQEKKLLPENSVFPNEDFLK